MQQLTEPNCSIVEEFIQIKPICLLTTQFDNRVNAIVGAYEKAPAQTELWSVLFVSEGDHYNEEINAE